MHIVAPIVMILALSGALYKTQEVWPMDDYKLYGIKPLIDAQFERQRMLTAIAAGQKQKAAAGGKGY